MVVTNSDTQSGTLTQGFTYTAVSNPAPTVTGISPERRERVAGGTAVTITGTGFLAGATVSLGGTPATGVTVVSSTSITATTPAHAAGAVDVVVSNAEQQSRHAGQWLYLYIDHPGFRSQRALGGFKFGHCSCRTNRVLHAVYRRRRTEWDSVTELHWLADGCKLLGTR